MKQNDGHHEANNARILTLIKQPIQITSMLGRYMFLCLRASIARVLYSFSTTRHFMYVLLFLVASLTGYLHASTPEFKRGGVYLSGDVILGKIKIRIKSLIDLIITQWTIHLIIIYLTSYFQGDYFPCTKLPPTRTRIVVTRYIPEEFRG